MASNSTLSVDFCCLTTGCNKPLAASLSPDGISDKVFSTSTIDVLALITIEANGAKTSAQIKKPITKTAAPPPIRIFLRRPLMLGTLTDFLTGFFGSTCSSSGIPSASRSLRIRSSVSIAATAADISLSSTAPPRSSFDLATKTSSPSITSLISSASVVSGILAWALIFFAIGIANPDAKLTNDESVVTITRCFFASLAARCSNFRLTTLCKTPMRFGGTRATTPSFDALILPTIEVMSSSVST